MFNKEAKKIAKEQKKLRKLQQKEHGNNLRREVKNIIAQIKNYARCHPDVSSIELSVTKPFTVTEFRQEFRRNGFEILMYDDYEREIVVSW